MNNGKYSNGNKAVLKLLLKQSDAWGRWRLCRHLWVWYDYQAILTYIDTKKSKIVWLCWILILNQKQLNSKLFSLNVTKYLNVCFL